MKNGIGADHAGWRLARFFNADVRRSGRHELCLIVSVCCFANEHLKRAIARTFLRHSGAFAPPRMGSESITRAEHGEAGIKPVTQYRSASAPHVGSG